MTNNTRTPDVPQDLLEHLVKAFPDKLPAAAIGLDQLGVLIGEQRVLRHLQALFKSQNKTTLSGSSR